MSPLLSRLLPRAARYAPGGFAYHALNWAVARLPLFENDGDYEAFERVLALALDKHPIRLLGNCLMPNHWHGNDAARSVLALRPVPEPADWIRHFNPANYVVFPRIFCGRNLLTSLVL
jgi:hypothetical protein